MGFFMQKISKILCIAIKLLYSFKPTRQPSETYPTAIVGLFSALEISIVEYLFQVLVRFQLGD